jgi:hypothetical protein
MTCRNRTFTVAVFTLILAAGAGVAQAQTKGRPPKSPVLKVRDGVYRVGAIEVDTIKKEMTVTGKINSDVTVLEFVANTLGGQKAYESAITIDTDGVTFNTALLLLGVDPARSRVPKQHFDPIAPKGDPLEVWVSWNPATASHPLGPNAPGANPAAAKKVRIEQLLYDESRKTTMPEGPWVYTGSTFLPDGRFWAEADGILIGFVHSPAPVIESIGGAGVNRFGAIILNPNIGLSPGLEVTLTVRATATAK